MCLCLCVCVYVSMCLCLCVGVVACAMIVPKTDEQFLCVYVSVSMCLCLCVGVVACAMIVPKILLPPYLLMCVYIHVLYACNLCSPAYLYTRLVPFPYLLMFVYGMATISRLLKTVGLFLQNIVSFIGLFCKRDL